MLIRVLATTLILNFCKIMLYIIVIIKSNIDPDDNF